LKIEPARVVFQKWKILGLTKPMLETVALSVVVAAESYIACLEPPHALDPQEQELAGEAAQP
jgi:hypothetical protein